MLKHICLVVRRFTRNNPTKIQENSYVKIILSYVSIGSIHEKNMEGLIYV